MRSRRLAIVFVALIGFALLAMAFRASRTDDRVQRWMSEANVQSMVFHDFVYCPIRGLEFNETAKRFYGQRVISVVVYNEDDAHKLLELPPCPVRMVARTIKSTPAEVVALLRERLGPDNVQ